MIAWIVTVAVFLIALREFGYYLPIRNEQVYAAAAAFVGFLVDCIIKSREPKEKKVEEEKVETDSLTTEPVIIEDKKED